MSSLPPTVTPIRPASPFEAARLSLIQKLLALKAPRSISVYPHPADFAGVVEHMREVAGIVDEWCAAIGHEVADNSLSRVDIDLFRSPLSDALMGNASYEVEKQIEALLDERDEMMRA